MTFTKEQLTERALRKVKELEFAITQSAFTSIRDGLNEELELARIALASLEAEPVAWECGENIILFNPDTVEAYAKRAEISPKPLYAAPPVSVTPGGWISCSERMPDSKTAVLVAREFDRKGDWRMKWATYIPGHPDANDGWIIPGASWIPSHWMPLPEPPQEEK
ncbi:DUF551 domain-containing protein [Salmonella enterica subsp. enterica serovar Veneziana]|nr:DUF551 domain-containing protein [Salmonella enterica subsp. enterica serovar Veneziana]ECJ8651380.1 DUF551 domain-containing protein [Salmonella enterica subsp. enterica serovar Veneziana]